MRLFAVAVRGVGVQRTFHASHAEVVKPALVAEVDEKQGLSAVHAAAAAAPNTLNCEIARKPVFGSVANGTV